MNSVKTYPFPADFLWGAATSSHQVEGNNLYNDWWEYEQTGRVPHMSADACQHYRLYEQDFDLARSWGHNAHRFSIEWSRIEPEEGKWSAEATSHYRSVLRALRARGLEPLLTLHHFTNPAWFLRRGGWLRSDSAQLFSRYVQYVADHLQEEVKYWLTINEPTVYAKRGYVIGDWPPCVKRSWHKATKVFKNMARAHVAAYRILHERCSDIMVGFAHSAPFIVPCNAARRLDRSAAWLRDWLLNRSFFRLIGTRFKMGRVVNQTLDFIGLNYYTRTIVRQTFSGLGALVGQDCQLSHHADLGSMSEIGWGVYPPGLKAIAKQFAAFGIPLMVTENGVATEDEELRSAFLLQHLQALAEAIAEGVNVIGYLYWTLMDNFEWTHGTEAHFGLAAVDGQTQQRLSRPCAELFSAVCRHNASLP